MEESGDIEIVQSGSIMSNKSCPSLRIIGIDQDPLRHPALREIWQTHISSYFAISLDDEFLLASDLSAPKEATTGNHKEALWHVRKYFEIKAAQSG